MRPPHRPVAGAGGIAALVLLLGSAVPAEAAGRAINKPWGVAALTNGHLIVMETDGGMLRVDPNRRKLWVLEPQFGAFLAVEMTAAQTGTDGDTVFVNLRLRTSAGAEFNRVRQYSVRGEILQERATSPSASFSGIAADPARQKLWLVDAQSGEIHELTLGGRRSSVPSKRLVRLRDVGILGPLAFDPESLRLFVADSVRGTLYGVSLETLEIERIASELGEPQALAVDARNRRLYVADPGGKRIWLVDLAAQEPSPRIYSRARELQSPVGITVAPDGIVWVADPRANKLFAIGPDGQVLKKLP